MPTLLQTPPQRRLPVFRPTEDFRRWYGRPLSRHQYEIIATLEAVRHSLSADNRSFLSRLRTHRHPAPRVLIMDPDGQSSVSLITSYLTYLDTLTPESDHQTLIVDSGRTALADIASHGYPNARLITARASLKYRGHPYRRLLMLNVQDYRSFSPFHRRPILWQQMFRTLSAPVPIARDAFVIIHMTLPKSPAMQRRRLAHLKSILPGVFNLQPDILARTHQLINRILDHNRRLNRPVAIPLDLVAPADDTIMHYDREAGRSQLCIKNCN